MRVSYRARSAGRILRTVVLPFRPRQRLLSSSLSLSVYQPLNLLCPASPGVFSRRIPTAHHPAHSPSRAQASRRPSDSPHPPARRRLFQELLLRAPSALGGPTLPAVPRAQPLPSCSVVICFSIPFVKKSFVFIFFCSPGAWYTAQLSLNNL